VAKEAGLIGSARFEVWLEGPQGTDTETSNFFASPSRATEKVKGRIRSLGLKGRPLTEFLSLLTIRCQQPSRQSIDAEVIKAIGAVWPHLIFADIESLYDQLLTLVSAAQANSAPPLEVRTAIAAVGADAHLSSTWGILSKQVLTRERLVALCPPLPSATDADLFSRATRGEATLLELKLLRAGATKNTVSRAKLARAATDAELIRIQASGLVDQDAVEALDGELLDHATSVAAMAGVSGLGPASRPAEFIYNHMASNAPSLIALDHKRVFKQNGRLLLGRICSVSDECKFGWGVLG
jgi:hypothetical protein